MTMAKSNGPSVFNEVHQAVAGGLFWVPARPNNHLASSSAQSLSQRVGIVDDETGFGPRLTGSSADSLGRSRRMVVGDACGLRWLLMAQHQPQQAVSHLVNGLLARSIVEGGGHAEEEALKEAVQQQFRRSLSKATSI